MVSIQVWAKRLPILVMACLASSALAPAFAQDTKPVVIASANDIITLDPHMVNNNHPTGSAVWSIFDSLVRRDLDGTPKPRLATSWERIDDLTWRFHLRQGVKFSNGEPFNASAVEVNFKRMDTPPVSATNQLHNQTGLKTVRIVDDYTIDLVTEKPTVNLLYWLAEAFIGAPKYLTETTPEEIAKNPVGSGPYKFVQWRRGDALTLEANQDYWGGKPDVQEVTFRTIPEVSSRLNELRAGTADLAVDLTPDTSPQANSDVSDLVTVKGLRKMHMGFSLNGEQPALKDPRVRQALNLAVDVPSIISSLIGNSTEQLTSVVNSPNNNPDLKAMPYDPEKAKALLAEAGYADGFPVTLQWSSLYSGGKEVSEVVGSYLEQVGIKPSYEAVETGRFREALAKQSLKGIYYMGWAALRNPSVELVILTCDHVDNSSGYCNPEYDKLVHLAAQTLNDEERQKIEFQAQAIIWADAPWLYLWHLPGYMGLSKKLNYEPRGDNYVEPYLITYK